MLDELTTMARDAVTSAGYAGVAGAMAAENLIPPIPSEIVLPLAGYEAARGDLVFAWVVLAATAGSMLGALVLYALGRYGGRPFVDRWGRLVGVTARDVGRADAWFARWGDWVVLGARVVPLARSAVSVPAGMARMPLGRFCALTAAGSLAWNVLLVGAGHQLGAHWEDVTAIVGPMSDAIRALAVLGVVALAILLLRRRRRASTA